MKGRKKDSGVLSGIQPKRETWEDVHNRVTFDSAEWLLVGLRTLIGDGSRLSDNHLSARAAKLFQQPDEIVWLWRKLAARFERAVLDGDAKWFERQAKALGSVQSQEKTRFNAKVVYLLESAYWIGWAKRRAKREAQGRHMTSTLTPALKATDLKASDIYNALEKHEKDGALYVEGCPFESKERAMDAIRGLAKRLQFALRKQPRPKRPRRRVH